MAGGITNDTAVNIESVKNENAISLPHQDTGADKNRGDTIWVETETMIAGISTVGARIVSLQMKEYSQDHNGKNRRDGTATGKGYVDLIDKKSGGGAGIMVNNASYDGVVFSVDSAIVGKMVKVKNGDSTIISFVNISAQGNKIKKGVFLRCEGVFDWTPGHKQRFK